MRAWEHFRAFLPLVVLSTILCFLFSCRDYEKAIGKSVKDGSVGPAAAQEDSLFSIRFTPQWHHQAQFAGYYMAKDRGFYKNYGLEVDIQDGGADNPAYEALMDGETDIITLFLLTALSRYTGNEALVNLAQYSQASTLMLVGKKSRGIDSLASLRGKKIGLWYSDFRELSLEFLRRNDIQAQIVPVDWTNTLFIHDAIDLINVMYYNEYHSLLTSGIDEKDLYVVRFSELGYDIVEDGIYTNRAFYNRNKAQCLAFAEASRDGWIYALNHPEETLQVVTRIMREHHIPTNMPHQRWMLNKIGEAILAKPASLGQLVRGDFLAARSLLAPQTPGLSDLKYEEFYPRAISGLQ